MRQWNSIGISDFIRRKDHCCLENYSQLEEWVRINHRKKKDNNLQVENLPWAEEQIKWLRGHLHSQIIDLGW